VLRKNPRSYSLDTPGSGELKSDLVIGSRVIVQDKDHRAGGIGSSDLFYPRTDRLIGDGPSNELNTGHPFHGRDDIAGK
jgi:hypothetical protein